MQSLENPVPVDRLMLDPVNPRLPEDLQNKPQSDILLYLYDNDDLDELMASMSQNAFFPSEPLLVLETEDASADYIVVEGNRRLGALMILLQTEVAISAGIAVDADYTESARLRELHAVPCILLLNREEVDDYLGFRHINGLREWAPEAKARYIYRQVEEAAREGYDDPFYIVGRRVGSNSLGVRNAYTSYNLLRHARDVLSIKPARQVLTHRFGVWQRVLGTANVGTYIGLSGAPTTYEEAVLQPQLLVEANLVEVLDDLVPQPGRQTAVLQDSRDATLYSEVLASRQARDVLREYNDLQLAAQIILAGGINARLRIVLQQLEGLLRDIARETLDDEAMHLAEQIQAQARSLRGAVVAAMGDL